MMPPGKGFSQLTYSTVSDKSDVTQVEGGRAVSTLLQSDQITTLAVVPKPGQFGPDNADN